MKTATFSLTQRPNKGGGPELAYSEARLSRGLLMIGLSGLLAATGLTLWSVSGQRIKAEPAAQVRQVSQEVAQAQAQVADLLLPVTESFARIAKEVTDRGLSSPEQLRTALTRRETADTLLNPLRRLPQGGGATIVDTWGHPLTTFTLPTGLLDGLALKLRREGPSTPWVLPVREPNGAALGIVLGARLFSSQGEWLGTVLTTSPAPVLSKASDGGSPLLWLAATDGTILAGAPGLPGTDAWREPARVPGLLIIAAFRPGAAGPDPYAARDVALIAAMLSAGLLAAAALLQASQRRQQPSTSQVSATEPADLTVTVDLMLDHMEQGVLVVSSAGVVEVCNRKAADLLQLPTDMMARRPRLDEVVSYQWRKGLFEHASNDLRLVIRKGGVPSQPQRYERQTTNGRVIEVMSIPMQGGGMVRTVLDITDRKAAERSLAFVAQHDELTQLANRAAVRDRLERELLAAAGTTIEIAILYLDLDRFKLVNDTRGHAVGDALLAQVGLRLRTTVRSGDLVGRIGGDEFAILLLNTSGSAVVSSIASDMLNRLAEPYMIDGKASLIGVSIGVALFPNDGNTASDLLRNADSALYRAKHAGRGVVRFFKTADDEADRTRLQLESDLRSALERQQFVLVYQPIIDCRTGEPVAFEALLRWHHPERGLVPPAEFIPVAEETGMIGPIGLWVMETACREAAAWQSTARISINLSPAQFRQQDLAQQITAILDRTGLAPERLELEVTEGVLLVRTEAVRRAMQALKQRGIRLVLDDFGTAHSSLSYLLSFPFSQIKIDKSFVWALATDASAKAIVEAVLGMAKTMQLDVVAEGVETSLQFERIRAMGCGYAQGYVFGRPASAASARDYIAGASRPPRSLFAIAAPSRRR